MKGRLDLLDLKILEVIGDEGPRNQNAIARKLGIKDATVRARFKRLRALSPRINLSANVYHTFIGLRKACVFAEAAPGKEKLLFDCMKANNFWLYTSRCYGLFEGCFALYAIPPVYEKEFESFLEEMERGGVANNIEFFWSTCFHTVNPKTNWFESSKNQWVFPWDQWILEMECQPTELPYSLQDPDDFPQKADYFDIFILKELEIDATQSLRSIASKLGISLQRAKYHYDQHVIKRRLLESFQVISYPFDIEKSDFSFFILKFPSHANMARFAVSLFDKPFARSVGKIHGEHGLFVQLYLPRREHRRLVDSLSALISEGFLSSYRYLFQDLRFVARQTIPYKRFDNGAWKYDPQEHLEELESLLGSTSHLHLELPASA